MVRSRKLALSLTSDHSRCVLNRWVTYHHPPVIISQNSAFSLFSPSSLLPFDVQLHCTLLNTSHRRTTPPGQRRGPRAARRIPFSFAALPQTPDGASNDFGIWAVDELQICEIGSWAPDGAYVRVAGCDLRPGR